MRGNLKDARKQLGLTAAEMAEKLHVTRRYYQAIEQGTRTGDYTIWDALEDITGIHQRSLRLNEDIRPSQEESL